VFIDHPDFEPRIEALVGELERDTQAEIVVVAARFSGSYRDVQWAGAAVAATLSLLVSLYIPVALPTLAVPALLLLSGWLGSWLLGRSPASLRLLARPSRREAQVIEAAKATFVETAVHGTRDRGGLLVYVSELEQRAALVRDLGIDGHAPGAAWNELSLDVRDLDELEALLREVGAILAEHLPAREDNPNEIPNAPRVRA
jgi:putative membrane protein